MKKIYTLFLGAVLFQSVQAQITLTASTHTPQFGAPINVNKEGIVSGSAEYNFDAQTGPNQVWDFSGIEFNLASEAEMAYVVPENNDFPGATIALILPEFFGQNKDDYMVPDANALHVVGQHNAFGDEKHIYSDGFDLLRYPMSYGDTYADEITGIIDYVLAGFPDWDKTATATITVDGYGDLVLPYGTITNVLRVKTVIDAQVGLMGAMLPQIETRFDWYHMDSNVPVVTSRRRDSETNDFVWNFAAISESELQTLSVNEESTLLNNLYPNPASNFVMLPADTEWSKLYDINGRLVKASTVAQQQIDTSDIKSGIYFVSIGIGQHVYRKKVIVQH